MGTQKNCKMVSLYVTLATVLLCCHGVLAADEKVAVEPAGILATLDSSHPRLMLKDKDLERLKQLHKKDKALQEYVRDVLKHADASCQKPMLTYDKIGPRLLYVSRECLNRVYALGLAWRWTGEQKYAARATENLLAVCAFDDWNPSHFLDTAEMSHAVGVGYDWLYHYLDEPTRRKIRAGLIELGLKPGIEQYTKERTIYTTGRASRETGIGTSWVRPNGNLARYNWNQVCNGGLLIGALAIAETDPEFARFIVPKAVAALPTALRTYGPDGAWPEGPGYWHYATRYTAYGLTALHTALGKDFGLSQITGLSEAGLFPIWTAGPTGQFLNFADSGEKNSRRPMPCMFWLARTYNNSLFADAEHAVLAKYDASPEHVVWYISPSANMPYPKALDHYFRGDVPVVVFRSGWDDPESLFVGVKAGFNQVNHGHLDLGNFELDALGVRWARDLGSDNYNLPGYWDRKKEGKRWTYYRLGSASHNVPLMGGEGQDPLAKSSFIKTAINGVCPVVLVDLTSAYYKFSKYTIRGVAMVQNRRAMLVQDEFELEKPCEVVWGMTTDADIVIRKNGVAVLTLNGKQLIAKVLSPADAEFVVASAEQKPPEKRNIGVKRLMVRLPEAKGSVRVTVLLSPVWKDGNVVKTVELKPLAQW